MSFNNGPSYPIVYEGNIPISAGDMRPETQYIVKYKKDTSIFMGSAKYTRFAKKLLLRQPQNKLLKIKSMKVATT